MSELTLKLGDVQIEVDDYHFQEPGRSSELTGSIRVDLLISLEDYYKLFPTSRPDPEEERVRRIVRDEFSRLYSNRMASEY